MFRNNTLQKAGVFIFYALVLISCEEILDVDFQGDSGKRLTVEGMITTDSTTHRVRLSYTGSFFDRSEQEMVSGAEVSISDGEIIYDMFELEAGNYYTRPDVCGEIGKTYTLKIRLPDGSEYEASEELHACPEIDSIKQSANYNSFIGGYGYDVLYYGLEPEPAGDYYMYRLYLNGTLYTDTITEVSFVSDEFVDGNYIHDFSVYRIREADLIADPTLVKLEIYSISKKYYDFLSALLLETIWKGSPWDGPPANLPGNVNNNARGYFNAADVKHTLSFFKPTPRIN